jgi:hypothetical protein
LRVPRLGRDRPQQQPAAETGQLVIRVDARMTKTLNQIASRMDMDDPLEALRFAVGLTRNLLQLNEDHDIVIQERRGERSTILSFAPSGSQPLYWER